jgi:hypothetical protein
MFPAILETKKTQRRFRDTPVQFQEFQGLIVVPSLWFVKLILVKTTIFSVFLAFLGSRHKARRVRQTSRRALWTGPPRCLAEIFQIFAR